MGLPLYTHSIDQNIISQSIDCKKTDVSTYKFKGKL